MASIDATSSPIDSSDNCAKRPSLQFALLILLLGWGLQFAIYAPMFKVMPAGDDFPMLREILRGNEQGPLAFFRESGSTQNYRPIKSLGLWACGHFFPEHRVFWVHFLHYTCGIALSLVLLLWIRTAPLGKAGVIAAVIALLLHPGLVGSLASLDGFDSVLSTCFVWLGAWFIYRFRERIIPCCVLACTCFWLGGLTKEYIFSLVPLGVWTMWHFSEQRRASRTAILMGALMVCFVLLMVIRHFTMANTESRGLVYLSFDPGQWAGNLTLFVVGLLLPGNTVWVFLNRYSPLFLVSLPMIAILCGVVFGGAWKCWGEKGTRHEWITYLVIATVLAMFPMIVMEHISEMYLPPLLVPFALLCGIAADGWRRYSLPVQVAIGVVSLAMLGNCIWAIHDKIAGMRLVGDRTNMQIDKLLAVLPREAKNAKICVAYNTFGMRPNRHYSVFMMGDEIMLVHAAVLDWKAPERKLTIQTFTNSETPLPDNATFNYYVVWDHRNDRMILTKRENLWSPSLGF